MKSVAFCIHELDKMLNAFINGQIWETIMVSIFVYEKSRLWNEKKYIFKKFVIKYNDKINNEE